MSPQTILFFLSFHLLSLHACIQEWSQTTMDCADYYQHAILPHIPECQTCLDFYLYLADLDEPNPVTWYSYWENNKYSNSMEITQCDAIIPISDQLDNTCLCQLQQVCNGLCDTRIQEEFNTITGYMIWGDPLGIPWNYVDQTDCQTVYIVISNTYQNLCSDTEIYKLIKGCADGTITQSGIPLPTWSPIPTTSPTTTTTNTTNTSPPTSSTSAYSTDEQIAFTSLPPIQHTPLSPSVQDIKTTDNRFEKAPTKTEKHSNAISIIVAMIIFVVLIVVVTIWCTREQYLKRHIQRLESEKGGIAHKDINEMEIALNKEGVSDVTNQHTVTETMR